jgi:uncharacterized protein YndB with AHSA1/START domain
MITETHDMVLTRVFDAPVAAVWRAWTEPEMVKRWWGPTGFTAPIAEMDVRVGGTSLVSMRAPAEFGGQEHYNTWTYNAVEPMERLEFIHRFTDAHRTPIEPSTLGLPPTIPREVPHLVTFKPLGDDRTELTVTESGYPNTEIVEISRGGMEQCLDKMAAALADQRAAAGQ